MERSENAAGTTDRLVANGLVCGYGKHSVLHDVSLTVGAGEIVTILGHNGAGKTTALKALFGLLPVQSGVVIHDGKDITRTSTASRVRGGMSYTSATSAIFRDLTVRQNLELGAFTVRDSKVRAERLARIHDLFPVLKDRGSAVAGRMSGGQQRLLSIGLALMSGAELMLLDEPSLGIAPSLVTELFESIRALSRDAGLSVVLVEQNVGAALPISDRVYYLRAGEILLSESADEARARDDWWELF
ncbi:ABC transporter ATP-binding protein [Herbiconiux oxytropis]|uniref:ABC transporter ATP-binding protein n=1 Tax=Herbiconiux oxytropis TaxID=2970915 RepID=UPI00217D353D|nr:ABC transporter ATP-binding protein [Herbiconiux oxytropis]